MHQKYLEVIASGPWQVLVVCQDQRRAGAALRRVW